MIQKYLQSETIFMGAQQSVIACQEVVPMTDAALTVQGGVFSLSFGQILGTAVGVTVIAGVGYYVYRVYRSKRINDIIQDSSESIVLNPSQSLYSSIDQSHSSDQSGNIFQSSMSYGIANEYLGQFNNSKLLRISEQNISQISSISSKSMRKEYDQLICPITGILMVQPVNLKCTHEFEKSAITHWLKISQKCPTCMEPAQISDIRDNKSAKNTIQRFRKRAIKKGQKWLQTRIQADFETQINPPAENLPMNRLISSDL